MQMEVVMGQKIEIRDDECLADRQCHRRRFVLQLLEDSNIVLGENEVGAHSWKYRKQVGYQPCNICSPPSEAAPSLSQIDPASSFLI